MPVEDRLFLTTVFHDRHSRRGKDSLLREEIRRIQRDAKDRSIDHAHHHRFSQVLPVLAMLAGLRKPP